MTPTPAWVRKLQVLYSVTFTVWLIAFVIVVLSEAESAALTGFYESSGPVLLGLYAPGLVYFFVASLRLSRLDPDKRNQSARRIFAVQQATGIPAMIGAIVGFLPAAVNLPSFFTMARVDQVNNAGMMIPWMMLYVFTTTYLIAATIRRGLKARGLVVADSDTQANPPEYSAPTESPASTTPGTNDDAVEPTRRLPIAPNAFLTVGILLLWFTVQTEWTAFTMARTGELRDLNSPGMAFSFLQFIDMFLGNAAALIVLIFGVINWPRDTIKFRKILTPVAAAVSLAIVPGNLALGVVGVIGLSGDAANRNADAAVSSEWINSIAESVPPEGFLLIDGVTDCSPAVQFCDDPDSSLTFTRIGDRESNAANVCSWAVAYAHGIGATNYAVAPDYTATPFGSADDAAATAACVNTLMTPDTVANAAQTLSPIFRLTGSAGDIPFQGDLEEIRWGTQSTDPGAHNYRFTIATTFSSDQLLPGEDQLSAGTHELNDLLTAIGQARLANPDTDPNDAGLIRTALESYPHDIPVKPVVDANGEVWLLELQTSDSPEVMCLSIAPWNEEYEGMPDPGTGYGVSSEESVEALIANPYFGSQAWGSCTP